jgi:hypothetical protein
MNMRYARIETIAVVLQTLTLKRYFRFLSHIAFNIKLPGSLLQGFSKSLK